MSTRMQNTGDTAQYLRISRGCSPCLGVARNVAGMFQSGGFVRTDGLRVLRLTRSDAWGDGPVFDAKVDSAPTVMKERAGAPLKRLPGGVVVYRFRLGPAQPWRLTLLTQVPS